MTDPTLLAHAALLAARDLVASAGDVTWTGPAAASFRDRLVEAAADIASLARAVEAIGPPAASAWLLPIMAPVP